jgi:hypothetical protein
VLLCRQPPQTLRDVERRRAEQRGRRARRGWVAGAAATERMAASGGSKLFLHITPSTGSQLLIAIQLFTQNPVTLIMINNRNPIIYTYVPSWIAIHNRDPNIFTKPPNYFQVSPSFRHAAERRAVRVLSRQPSEEAFMAALRRQAARTRRRSQPPHHTPPEGGPEEAGGGGARHAGVPRARDPRNARRTRRRSAAPSRRPRSEELAMGAQVEYAVRMEERRGCLRWLAGSGAARLSSRRGGARRRAVEAGRQHGRAAPRHGRGVRRSVPSFL